jgi:hypothetical protein
MANPADFGDPFPSDTGDVSPVDPTAAFAERDFRLKRPEARAVKARPPVRSTPDLRIEPPRKDTRTTFQGRVVKRESDGKWVIIRQDGFRGVGVVQYDDQFYDTLKIGDQVTLISGQVPGVWHIVSRSFPKEMSSIRLTNNATVQTSNAEKTIKFDELIEMTGDPNDPTYDNETSEGQEIVIKRNLRGEHEISLTVTVETTKPKVKKRTTIVTAIRDNGDYIQVLEGEAEIPEWLVEPRWVNVIPLTICSGY